MPLPALGASDSEALRDGWLGQPANTLSSVAYVVAGAWTDTLDLKGAGVNESMSPSAEGRRAVLLRDLANIRMEMDGVDRLGLTALGGADAFTVNHLTGTDFRRADVDLSAPTGGGDAQTDTVTVNGTPRRDRIDVETEGARVDVGGLRTEVRISGSGIIDRLQINGLDGDGDFDVDDDVSVLLAAAVDLGSGQR
ncbi:MAG: hypothetical protein ACRD0U_03485 [Acidimicrobiales bacterium]